MKSEEFGTTPAGERVERFVLDNGDGLRVSVLTYGAVIQSIEVPGASGEVADVVLGCDSMDGYLTRSRYFGALVGRYGNRVAGARFVLDGVTHRLVANEGENTLHGGKQGFDKRVWSAESSGDDSVTLSYVSPDGEEGFPGTLRCSVTYTVTVAGELRLDYRARTDAPTVLNLTNHSYFNLAGAGSGDVLGQVVTLDADRYLPVNPAKIPTGDLAPVAGTPFDFTRPRPLGERIENGHPQLRIGGGYDHCYALNAGDGVKARVFDPGSGRVMEVLTTEPGVQFYTGNGLDPDVTGYGRRSALCLETQHYPDSPNQRYFPSTVLRPGEEYNSTTVYRFSVAS
jgi:aldose 1-epimerase